MNNTKIWQYDRYDVYKEIYICHYWYFLGKGFKFQQYICSGYYELLILSINP